MQWYLMAIKKYAQFAGRSRRREYWFFVLFNIIIAMVLGFVDGMLGFGTLENPIGPLAGLYTLAVFIPGLAVSIRRLHDTDRSGWWLLIAFVPFIGALVLLVFMVMDGTPGDNRFGPSPKAAG